MPHETNIDWVDFQSSHNENFSELSNEALLVVDVADDVVLHANPAVVEILGVALTEKRQSFSDLLRYVEPGEADALCAAILRSSSRSGVHKNVGLEHPVSGRRSIRVRSFESASPDSEIFVVLEDITDHIRFEVGRINTEVMRCDAVVREIHHRINNQLHGVMMQLEGVLLSPETKQTVTNAAIGRISAIARLNGLLTRVSAEISIVELVVQLTAHVEQTLSNHVLIEVVIAQPRINEVLIAKDAVAVALAINDLVMHACNISGDGKVVVGIESTQSGASEILIRISCLINPHDGLPNGAFSKGFGLADSLLNGTDSTVSVDHQPESLEITLKLGAHSFKGH